MRPLVQSAGAILIAITLGCGSSAERAGSRESAAESYNTATTAFENKDFAAAAEQFTAAIDARGLNPDQYADAFLKRAVANATLANYDAAHADLDMLERGAPNLDEVYAARAFVLLKQGKRTEAQAAFNKAKQINPQVKPFQG
jgi:tetratricopeptide (TPR) repeat protein